MIDFEFDRAPTPGANKTAAVTDCERCHGHRMVMVSTDKQGHELWDRCPDCNPWPEPEQPEPTRERRWWEE